jgi:hypothetical protein
MPTRSDWIAATPRCTTTTGPLNTPRLCDQRLRWADRALGLAMPRNEDYMDGSWCCSRHGAVMSGTDAAMRAGFLAYVMVESEAA